MKEKRSEFIGTLHELRKEHAGNREEIERLRSRIRSGSSRAVRHILLGSIKGVLYSVVSQSRLAEKAENILRKFC